MKAAETCLGNKSLFIYRLFLTVMKEFMLTAYSNAVEPLFQKVMISVPISFDGGYEKS
jgi:hypothetical protein